ncbi:MULTISPECIES: tRNA (guanosine(37)-N1)-methyltransferase TrmD [Shouchella]|uniref:tRNA (guanine-N(1)-)-methyltransferase n=2 Tax=Shouchella TaxID=2893057 RepID=A0ABY7WAR4_9BACI|nr:MULTISPECIES: tRNA (guanosine(37)-N1)-methyltransferase TrmD [Shouchella]MED4127320.1 tRNA (guanosine(37)-N1)-methyltransferase TrmD [Shouchella miscanthi]WDF03795.1 tRNA (guanosine(37)-N1)-methyltransferase TrmD [Shouchella hunanensis]GAF23334.1 tRNA (guanine37-N1) -methyltransferase [Bacillus sp. JCM 19047]
MKIDILTLFPEMFTGVFGSSILKQAQEKGLVTFQAIDFREFTTNKHRKVDDYPYGGGAGMVLTPQPIFDAVDHVTEQGGKKPRIVLLCPQGERFTQAKAEEFSQEDHIVFLCGHYEGFDERVRESLVTDEISIGDFVLTGGELAAMVLADSITRLLPGVLGNEDSAVTDSYSTGLLEHPHYTRPATFRGLTVPDVLRSGHHENIEKWRREESLRRTFKRRPDLLNGYALTKEEAAFIEQLKSETKQ